MKTRKAQSPRIPDKWDRYYRALTRRRIRLLAQESARTEEVRGSVRAPDPGDVAEKLEENDDSLAEIKHDEAELVEIDAALLRIRRGTYGVCEATGRRIPAIRLRAIPWTRYTLESAANRENGGARK